MNNATIPPVDLYAWVLGMFALLWVGTQVVKGVGLLILPERSQWRRAFQAVLPLLPTFLAIGTALAYSTASGPAEGWLPAGLLIAGTLGAHTSQLYHVAERFWRALGGEPEDLTQESAAESEAVPTDRADTITDGDPGR